MDESEDYFAIDKQSSDIVVHRPVKNITVSKSGCLWFSGFAFDECKIPLKSSDDVIEILSKYSAEDDIVSALFSFEGAWFLIYWRFDINRIFIGRDIFGRKSLLWSHSSEKLYFSQTVKPPLSSWYEYPCGYVTVLNCSNGSVLNEITIVSSHKKQECNWTSQWAKFNFIFKASVNLRLLSLSHQLPSVQKLLTDELSMLCADELLKLMKGSIRRLLSDVSFPAERIAILFSGGVDSLLIAHLTRSIVPRSSAIDLVNVSFGSNIKDMNNAPDRKHGIEAFSYLCHAFGYDAFRLILVNVTRDELAACRQEYIGRAIAPNVSVLDDSIGCVQWFANRGRGVVYKEAEFSKWEQVSLNFRVSFVGSGADELFGGYSRHRSCFENGGRDVVLNEMEEELERIGSRNLGRDDRVAISVGRDTRAPFLDESVVAWATKLPLELKADFTKPRGVGEKLVIRQALKVLGCPSSLYNAPKRAMQFGTRIAKLEDRKEKGSDICQRLSGLLTSEVDK
ncbi:hypothetical protein AB6A40_003877 [Gnathostoma spinigerum]|uniref:Asparagine synthetase domain-containing protein n=1 Tax=Gnathostoma spinigerum TaxID=75299 RepID=A0ABD6EAU4_9BILA